MTSSGLRLTLPNTNRPPQPNSIDHPVSSGLIQNHFKGIHECPEELLRVVAPKPQHKPQKHHAKIRGFIEPSPSKQNEAT